MSTSRPKPLPEDLPPEVRKLAEYVTSLFDQLGKPISRYAQEKSLPSRDISRFLRGQEIPSPSFMSSLLRDVAVINKRLLSPEEIEQAQKLRLDAVRASTNAQYELEHLRTQLEIANVAREQADERLRTLVDVMAALRGEIGIVQEEGRELESRPRQKAITAKGQRELEQRRQSEHTYLVRTQEGIESEIERLNIELSEAREAKDKAEKKCQDLEVALKEALQKFAIIGGLIGRPNLELSQGIMAYIDDRRIRWGGVVGWCIGPLATYGLPAYLGGMYQLIGDQSVFLKGITLTGLIIPAWFAYGIKRLERAGVSRIAHLIHALAVTAIIFTVASVVPLSVWFPGLRGG